MQMRRKQPIEGAKMIRLAGSEAARPFGLPGKELSPWALGRAMGAQMRARPSCPSGFTTTEAESAVVREELQKLL